MNGPSAMPEASKMVNCMRNDIERVLVGEEQLRNRIRELGQTITAFYQEQGVEEIVVVAITNGAIVFAADLIRQIDLYARLDCVRVSSYQDESRPVTEPEIIDQVRIDIGGSHTLLIDDIVDTGSTLKRIADILRAMEPETLRTCVLLDKQGRRSSSFDPDFTGFDIPNEFVVGYGLDFAELYRNLPCIGVLKAARQNPPEWP